MDHPLPWVGFRTFCAKPAVGGFAQKVLVLGFLCAPSVSSVSLWCGFTRNFINHRDTEDTEVAQRREILTFVQSRWQQRTRIRR